MNTQEIAAPMTMTNLALRFATEIAGIAAVAYAGLQVDATAPVRVVVGILAATGLVGTWAAVVAPKNHNGLAPLTKDLIGSVILLVAAGALAWSGQPALAIGLAIAVGINTLLLGLLGTEPRDRTATVTR
jgi:hypothetical protein